MAEPTEKVLIPKKSKSRDKATSPHVPEETKPQERLNAPLETILNKYDADQLEKISEDCNQQPKTRVSSGPILCYALGSAGLGVGCLICFLFYHEDLTGWGAFWYNAIAYGFISKNFLINHFGDGCLLSNPFYKAPPPFIPAPEDCYLCEATDGVDRLSGVTYEDVKLNYLDRGRPLIVRGAMDGWDSTRRGINVEDIANIFLDSELASLSPCFVDTNLKVRTSVDMREFLQIQKRISRGVLDKWFIQWQNCKMKAVRGLRAFYKRLDFWDPSVDPEHFSWVIMSANHAGRNPKKVELDYGLIIVYQIKGSLDVSLTPHHVCYEDRTCVPLSETLLQGEVLIFTNLLWTFDYIPYSVNTTSVAIITEAYWK